MKKLLLCATLACLAFVSYAQRDVRAGGELEVASVESNDDYFAIYKVKDKAGTPSYFFSAGHVAASFNMELFNAETTFSTGDGVILLFGETYEDALENLEELIELFSEDNGSIKEFSSKDGTPVAVVLHKGCLGKHLSIGPASITRSAVKSLRTSLKISKKLHPDI